MNRGPDSLGALRQLKKLQESGRAECLLGNHDLHLLAIDAGIRKTKGLDTVANILKAPRSPRIDQLVTKAPNGFERWECSHGACRSAPQMGFAADY